MTARCAHYVKLCVLCGKKSSNPSMNHKGHEENDHEAHKEMRAKTHGNLLCYLWL